MSVNAITPTGLTIQTITDILNELVAGMQAIYGPNINVNPNSPDGQMLNIVALAKEDSLQLIQQVNASFDPDQAVGTVLDQRCAINGVLRTEGTFTQQAVSVTSSQAATLQGLDLSPASPFTVSDSAGNQFQLVTTFSFVAAGTSSLTFQAALIGAVQTTINTITTIVTPQLGITSVNNPLAASSVGVNEQTDASLKIARRNGISKASRSFQESVFDNVAQVAGVTSVQVYENSTGSPITIQGITLVANSILVIVAGGAQLAVATAINNGRSLGVAMNGGTTQVVTNPDGSTITIAFDYAIAQNLFISFAYTVVSGSDPGGTFLANQIAAHVTFQPGQTAVASVISAFVQSVAPNISITSMGVSNTAGSYVATKLPTDAQHQWVVSASNIVT